MILYADIRQNHFLEEYITKNDVRILSMGSTSSEDQTIRVFGARLRQMRERMGLRQEELSQAVHDMLGDGKTGSQPHISNMENSDGEKQKLPSVQVLRALAVILKTNTDYFLGLTNNDRPFGDLEDEVVVTVEEPNERRLVQEVAEVLAEASAADKEYVAGLIYRILPKKPRNIGE